jgi:Icc-related predicted phosphoesterase
LKIQLISDLHLEFHRDHGREFISELPVVGDVLVIAGDMCPILDGTDTWRSAMVALLEKFPHVVYVPGNHDYFGSSFAAVGDFLPMFARGRNMSVLVNQRRIIQGVPFIGTTLWYGAETHGMLSCDAYNIADSQLIHPMNMLGREFLAAEVQADDVVVTHHLPSYGSVAPQFVGSDLNVFFVSDCEDIISARRPQLWLHGHTHTSCDHVVCDTRVVCNPHGYPSERRSEFVNDLVIEVR